MAQASQPQPDDNMTVCDSQDSVTESVNEVVEENRADSVIATEDAVILTLDPDLEVLLSTPSSSKNGLSCDATSAASKNGSDCDATFATPTQLTKKRKRKQPPPDDDLTQSIIRAVDKLVEDDKENNLDINNAFINFYSAQIKALLQNKTANVQRLIRNRLNSVMDDLFDDFEK